MTRKRNREGKGLTSSEASGVAESVDAGAQELLAASPTYPIIEEVQSFLSKRAELAMKLGGEIEATEIRLAELKKTLAMLFPEKENLKKDRKAKKVRTKVPSPEKPELGNSDEARADSAG